MSARACFILAIACLGTVAVHADELLYRYEADVLPYDESAGWLNDGYPCETPCVESLEDGHFVLRWPVAGGMAVYRYWIAKPGEQAPPTLWVEWRFRSNHPIGPYFYSCDGTFTVKYGGMMQTVFMYGDAAISFDLEDFVLGLDMNDFHTYRTESLDGVHYRVSVDGLAFIVGSRDEPNGAHYLNLVGRGGCTGDFILNQMHEWDFVRYGTISYGEQIIASDPPSGFVDARQYAGLDRFTVTFDEPNYVYLDEITVEVTGGVAPEVIQTRRRENDEPDTVEIVLDRPIAFGQTTRFTFDDGVAVNVVEYTFAPGDTDGDGDADLYDFALLQTCIGQSPPVGPCAALDLRRDGTIDLADYALFQDIFSARK